MKDIEQYKKRFYNLMESTMGDVKPLINEEGQQDYDHFGKIIVPQMKKAGFKFVDESKIMPLEMCKYYNGNCCKYFCYPDHNNGVNLSLNCQESAWSYMVFYKGNKGIKNFPLGGTDDNSKKAAQDAINYAISLKNKLYPPKQPKPSPTKDTTKPEVQSTVTPENPYQGTEVSSDIQSSTNTNW